MGAGGGGRRIGRLVPPALALGAAVLLILPGGPSRAFSKNGGRLGTDQRDVRVFDNFLDASANDNTVAEPMFPGFTGAELAIWKGAAEWGSGPHGDGTGDPTQGVLGSGGANFDYAWMGRAGGVGNVDHNIVSVIQHCGGGTLAYTETPVSDGWRIRFCENVKWADGPGAIGAQSFDLQSVATHELGHALGLSHSTRRGATMYPSTDRGETAPRAIRSDDQDGLRCIYGAASPTKPAICETEVVGGTVRIRGSGFHPTSNEVWFTSADVTGNRADPRVRVLGVPSASGGASIELPIPGGAGAGVVLVKLPGGDGGELLSNGFPFDPVGPGGSGRTISAGSSDCGPLDVALVTPAVVEALVPGTAPFLTATGSRLDTVTRIDLGSEPIPASRWTAVDPSTITIDLPQAPSLGLHALVFHGPGGAVAAATVTVVEPAAPALEVGTGDPLNPLTAATGMDLTLAGEVGAWHLVLLSTSDVPSVRPWLALGLGDGFTRLRFLTVRRIPAPGWRRESLPLAYRGPTVALYLQSVELRFGWRPRLRVSNLQTVTIGR